MLHEEVEKYINLSGDKEAWQNTSVSRIGGYLDGYDKGLEVLDKVRAEIDKIYEREGSSFDCLNALDELKEFIDKYKGEMRDKE